MSRGPSFRVAPIVIFTDLTRQNARVIPLGSLAEVMLPHMQGLALQARTALHPGELETVPSLIRNKLVNPFEFLKQEFELAWRETAGKSSALDFLAAKHASSLSVLAPTDWSGRSWLFERLIQVRSEAVEAKLGAAVDAEFSAMLTRYGAHVDAQRKLIESETFKAA